MSSHTFRNFKDTKNVLKLKTHNLPGVMALLSFKISYINQSSNEFHFIAFISLKKKKCPLSLKMQNKMHRQELIGNRT